MPSPSQSAHQQFIQCFKPYFWGNEANYVNEAIRDGWISSRGKFIESFERKFAEMVGVDHAVAVCNGTVALHLALVALDIQPGDEVIVPDFCMIAPIFAILYCGAVPVPVEVDETWNISPDLIEAKITERTRAILVVHNYGHPARMDQISEIARRHGLCLIEDAAEALGATVGDRKIGSFGDVSCFSLYANKVITTGEGGMLVTNNAALCLTAQRKRDMNFGTTAETRYTHDEIGYNYRMTNLQAAVGVAQIEHFEAAVNGKIEVARRYYANLRDLPGLTLPPETAWGKNVFWTYGVVVNPEFGMSRAKLQQSLYEAGIDTRRFFTPVHQQPAVIRRGLVAAGADEFARSRSLSKHGLCLPSYLGLEAAEIDRISETIRKLAGRQPG
ncbi:MAG TPA: DegT/DnrJ/EryC1/StrS family aminotransferase [Blastocatellia bacterium]|nr:DegT/DnrJ/EryC1/StrS family aminotransferase [Blastocatellia bacterium]